MERGLGGRCVSTEIRPGLRRRYILKEDRIYCDNINFKTARLDTEPLRNGTNEKLFKISPLSRQQGVFNELFRIKTQLVKIKKIYQIFIQISRKCVAYKNPTYLIETRYF